MQNPSNADVVVWLEGNTTLEILNLKKMEQEILPFYFRHSKFESFVRQLNLYGFKKLKAQGRHIFTHPLLQAGASYFSINASLATLTAFKCSRQKEKVDNNK